MGKTFIVIAHRKHFWNWLQRLRDWYTKDNSYLLVSNEKDIEFATSMSDKNTKILPLFRNSKSSALAALGYEDLLSKVTALGFEIQRDEKDESSNKEDKVNVDYDDRWIFQCDRKHKQGLPDR